MRSFAGDTIRYEEDRWLVPDEPITNDPIIETPPCSQTEGIDQFLLSAEDGSLYYRCNDDSQKWYREGGEEFTTCQDDTQPRRIGGMAPCSGWINMDAEGALYRWGAFEDANFTDTIARFSADFASVEVIYSEEGEPHCMMHGSDFVTGP